MQEIKYPYAKQSISEADKECVRKVLGSPLITRGPETELFENEVASYCGARFAVAFNSASSALLASFFAAKASARDRLLTTPNSFVASLAGACKDGATPVFIDIDRKTGNIDVEKLSYNMEPLSTRGKNIIVPVHFAGIPVDMERISSYIKDQETFVIEDAAHALGSCYKDGSKVGSCLFSQITVFSFHPAKTITTGEGGMCTTNNEELYRLLRYFRNNGIERDAHFFKEKERGPWVYEVMHLTGNYHMNEMQSALGRSQLARLAQFVEKRKKLLEHYRKRLSDKEGIMLLMPEASTQIAWHIFVAQIDFPHFKKERAHVMEELKTLSIGTQVHYIPLYRHPFFKDKAGDIKEYFPENEKYYSQALTLPLYFDLELKDVDYIVDSLLEILGRA